MSLSMEEGNTEKIMRKLIMIIAQILLGIMYLFLLFSCEKEEEPSHYMVYHKLIYEGGKEVYTPTWEWELIGGRSCAVNPSPGDTINQPHVRVSLLKDERLYLEQEIIRTQQLVGYDGNLNINCPVNNNEEAIEQYFEIYSWDGFDESTKKKENFRSDLIHQTCYKLTTTFFNDK